MLRTGGVVTKAIAAEHDAGMDQAAFADDCVFVEDSVWENRRMSTDFRAIEDPHARVNDGALANFDFIANVSERMNLDAGRQLSRSRNRSTRADAHGPLG